MTVLPCKQRTQFSCQQRHSLYVYMKEKKNAPSVTMTTPKLNSHDKKELEKFTKYLVYKCIQVIVQSRLGEKVRTQSKAVSSGSDWFNLALRDLSEVFSETKKVFTGSSLSPGQNVCVEMSLQTAEGDNMVLETWTISMLEQFDSSSRVSYTVYSRMGVLLKSLICVSRVTPAYRLSRKQGADTYVICYRIYMGEPQSHHLGEGFQSIKVGAVSTPVGTITLNVMYRTKLLISPQPSCKDLSIDLKDDHFNSEAMPRRSSNAPKPCHTAFHDVRPISEEPATALYSESQETCATTFSTSPTDFCPSPPHPAIPNETPPPMRHRVAKLPSPAEDNTFFLHGEESENKNSFSLGQKMGAFAPVRETTQKIDYDDIPFLALLQQSEKPDANAKLKLPEGDTVDAPEPMDQNSRSSTGSSRSLSSHPDSAPDDFVMVELKTPFAGTDANTDLGRFYRDCQGAPSLSMFDQSASVEETLNAITDQLATFEAHAKDYDAFLEALDEDEN